MEEEQDDREGSTWRTKGPGDGGNSNLMTGIGSDYYLELEGLRSASLPLAALAR